MDVTDITHTISSCNLDLMQVKTTKLLRSLLLLLMLRQAD